MFLNGEEVSEFEFEVKDDTEIDTLIDALKTIVQELETNKVVK